MKISKLFFFLVFFMTLAFSSSLAYFWIHYQYEEYEKEVHRVEKDYVELNKSVLRKQVQLIVTQIEYRRSKIRTRVEKELMERVHEIHGAVTSLYDRNRGKLAEQELGDLIRGYLESYRYNSGKGRFFVVDLNGNAAVSLGTDPEWNQPKEVGDASRSALGGVVEPGKGGGEGFIEYVEGISGGEGAALSKIGFIKVFEPLNWAIGTGECLEFVEKSLQKEMQERLNETWLGPDGYFAAFSFDGVQLVGYKQENIGVCRWDFADRNGVKVVQEAVRLAKTPEGGFVEYCASIRPTTGISARKISFFMGIPEWQWAIGTGVYLDEIDAYVENKKAELSRKISDSVILTLFIFILVTTLLLSVLAYVFRRINAGFQAFSSFFERAAIESTPIDSERLNFEEFKKLAVSANRMIGERRKAENALRSSESRYRAVVQDQTELICRFRHDNRIIFANEAFCRFFEKPYEHVVDSLIATYVHEADIPALEMHLSSLTRENPVGTVEHRTVEGDGAIHWLQWTNRAIFDESGGLVEFQAVGRNITENKRSEKALLESERRLREMLEKVKLVAVMVDVEGNLIYCNPFLLEITGWAKEDVLGRNWFDTFIPAESRDELRRLYLEKLPRDRFPSYYENEILTKSGIRRLIAWSNTTTRDIEGKVIGGTAIGEDATERRLAETERIRLVTAIEQSAEAVFITDTDWRISYVNPAFERLSGYSRTELIGQVASMIGSGGKQDGAYFEKIGETLAAGRIWSGKLKNTRKDGKTYEAEVTASPVRDNSGTIINYVSIHRDITNEMKLERDLRQAQKMEAIGTLAGGIAHDFNNILTAIIGYTEMAHLKTPEGTPVRRNLDQVLKAGARAKDLVKQILTFSRQSEHEQKPVRIAPIVKEALKLLRSSLPTTIEIRQKIEVSQDEGVVMTDPTQVHQVLMNLCANSAHAMREKGGVLSVHLSEIDIDAHLIPKKPELKPGRYVKLAVSDTGHGMDHATMDRIYDPYFTTKKPGEGTGMGLAVVQGIVKNCGGAISVYSEVGQGTIFRIYFPRAGAAISPVVEIMESLPRGSERILFVDDENGLVELGKEMLETLGYHVTGETSSLKALETFRQRPQAFDLVITDMTMPHLTGLELAKELQKVRSDIPIILCTGFSEMLTGQKPSGVRETLMKPYAITHLSKTIREVFRPGAGTPS